MSSVLPVLIVYAYSSFTSSWGMGPDLVEKFEKQQGCRVILVDGGDGGAVLARLKLEGEKSGADVVVGVDGSLLFKLKKDLHWTSKPVPFDYAPYAFVYNSKRVTHPPRSLDDLLKPEWKNQIVLEDPRLSTVGLGFLLWVIKEKGDGAWEFLKKIKTQIKIISPSWDLAYGLFKKDQTKLVFSYWTSPAYHIQEEGNDQFKAASFTLGHYLQREFLVVNPRSKNIKLAMEFVKYMGSDEAQSEISKKNFMYPVSGTAKVSGAVEKLGKPKVMDSISEKDLEENLEAWLKRWREIFS